jgi:putative ABC transport system substrate-binding protein
MRRREFMALVVAATAGKPFLARAQQKARVYRIAVVHPATPVAEMTEMGRPRYGWRGLFERLRELGYVEGQNLVVERFSGEGRTEHFADLVAEVVRSKPDVIFTLTARLTRDFKAATDTIPVVANVADPIAYGIVTSLARPGGNITGTTSDAGVELWGKRFGLLREMVPAASKIGFLASRRVWDAPDGVATQEAAKRMNISLVGPALEEPLQEAEYRRVFAAMTAESVDALAIGDQGENTVNLQQIVELAENARMPAIYPFGYMAGLGGLIAYGIKDFYDVFRYSAEQIDQILKGVKPGDIPFYQPTNFELAINVKTAKALGIETPGSLLARADEVIE